jgi:hypothetical protein
MFTAYNRDRDSLFALTDRRAIRMWPIHSVPYLDEHGETVRIKRRLLGGLTFGDRTIRTRRGMPRLVKPGRTSFLDFFAIRGVKQVLLIAVEAQRKAIENRSSCPAA